MDDAVYPKRCGTTKSKQAFIPKEVTAWIARQVELNATGFENILTMLKK